MLLQVRHLSPAVRRVVRFAFVAWSTYFLHIRSRRADSAPGGRSTVDSSRPWQQEQPGKGTGCADQTLSVWTGQALPASSDPLNSIAQADEVFPGEVVDQQSNRCGDRKGVRGEAGNGEVHKTGDHDTERREQNQQQRAVEADGELQARAHCHKEDIPKAPGVG